MTERQDYKQRRAFFDRMLTVYGRKSVLECLLAENLQCYALHLAQSNRPAPILDQIVDLAGERRIEIKRHSREALGRLSKNARQDQGVALDVLCPGFRTLEDFLAAVPDGARLRLLALDGITNPQNLGMIIRSATAGEIDGILLTRRGNAALGPLVIKASAGTVFRAPLILGDDLSQGLAACREQGFELCVLSADAAENLFQAPPAPRRIFILGNESSGVSPAVARLADRAFAIPMRNGVESLNVAVTAGLIAFANQLV